MPVPLSPRLATRRLLIMSASGVLAALRGSTYDREYASPLRLLRPCRTAFLNSLRAILNEPVNIRCNQSAQKWVAIRHVHQVLH